MRARREDLPDPVATLGRRAPWDALGQEGLPRAARALRPRRLARGEALLARGEALEGPVVVASGALKVGRIGAHGREQILYVAREGKTIAETFPDPSARDGRSPVSVTALEAATAWVLPLAELEPLLAEPPFARAVLGLLARRLAALCDLAEDLALRDVPARLAGFLHQDALRGGAVPGEPHRIERTLAVETVAAQLGTVREEIQRALKRLADRKLIALSRKEIVILDLDELATAASP